jgi:hypothetical protein
VTLTLSEDQLKNQVRYFAYYQLAGGVLVMGLIILLLVQVESLSGLLLVLYTGLLSLAGFTIYCGYLTLKHPARGLELSRISLLIQFLKLSIGGFSFKFSAGPLLAIGIDLSNDFHFKVDASIVELSFNINTSAPSDTLLVSINVVAVLLFMRTTLWLNEWNARYKREAV